MPEKEFATVLGFDYGIRRTGVAVGQSLTKTATPLRTLESLRGQPDWNTIAQLIEEWRPAAIVVGKPDQSSPTNEQLVRSIAEFCEDLRNKFNLPVYTVDEAYTSKSAYQELRDARERGTHGQIKRPEIDQRAAAILLEAWMADHNR